MTVENLEIIHFEEVTSTNDIAKKIIDSGENYCNKVITATYQTKGRGAASNSWTSKRGENLLMSIIFCPQIHASKQFYISKAISLALIEYLKSRGVNAKIKWPNDIIVNRQKIAGILIENTISGINLQTSIIGIGLNVNQIDFQDLIIATSLKKETGKTYNLLKELNDFLEFVTKFLNLCNDNFAILDENYRKNLIGIAEFLQYRDKNGYFRSKIKEIDEFGRLVLIDEKSQQRVYGFKEVELIM